MPSSAARITISTSSTISGPLTATDRDFLPLADSHRYTSPPCPWRKIDASVTEQVARNVGLLVQLKIRGRAYDRRAVVFGHAYRDHVPKSSRAICESCS